MITYNIQVWTKSFGCHHRPTSIRFWTCIVQKRKSCLFIPQLISLRNNTSLHVCSTARYENIIPMFVLISIIRYDSYSFIPYKLDGIILPRFFPAMNSSLKAQDVNSPKYFLKANRNDPLMYL